MQTTTYKRNKGYKGQRIQKKYNGKRVHQHRKRKMALFAIPVNKKFHEVIANKLFGYLSLSIVLIMAITIVSDYISINKSISMTKESHYVYANYHIPKFKQKAIKEPIIETEPVVAISYSNSSTEDEVIEEEVVKEEEIIVEEPTEEIIVEEPVETELDLQTEPVGDIVTPEAEQIGDDVVIEYLGDYRITGYDPFCSHCCGKSDGITASGNPAEYYSTVAMNDVEFGTKIYIPNYGIFTVEDRGGSMVGVDIACPGHDACYVVTNQRLPVYVVVENNE